MIDDFPPEVQDDVMTYAEATYRIAYRDAVDDTLAQVYELGRPPVRLEPLPVLEKLEDYQQEFLDELWDDMEHGRWSPDEPHEPRAPAIATSPEPEPQQDPSVPPPRRRFTHRRGRNR